MLLASTISLPFQCFNARQTEKEGPRPILKHEGLAASGILVVGIGGAVIIVIEDDSAGHHGIWARGQKVLVGALAGGERGPRWAMRPYDERVADLVDLELCHALVAGAGDLVADLVFLVSIQASGT